MPSQFSPRTPTTEEVDPAGSVLWSRGTRFFATGSVLLLLGGLAWNGRNFDQISLGVFWPATALALVSHLVGWTTIGRAVLTGRREYSDTPLLSRAMTGVYLGSIAGVSLGLLTLPLAFPEVGWGGPGWLFILWFGFFPYIPSVFAPAVFGHSVLFLLRGSRVGNRRGLALVIAGGFSLCVLGCVGLASQISRVWFLGNSVVLLSGLTCIGYGFVATVWRLELRRNFVGGPAGPEAGKS